MRRFRVFFLFLVLVSCCAGASEFLVIKNQIAEIHYQPGVSPERARQCEADFNTAYALVGKELGFAARTVKIYIYTSTDELLDDIINRFGYDAAFFRATRATPRMSNDYAMWTTIGRGIDFLTHEYSHRIIEQLAGIGSQVNYRWFDEGLADYEGNKALALASPGLAKAKIEQEERYLAGQFESGELLKLDQITTGPQWSDRMVQGQSRLIYAESARIMNWLVDNYGIGKAKEVLERIGKHASFRGAFQEVYGFNPAELEQRYREHLRGLSAALKQKRAGMRFNFTLDDDLWQLVKPLIDDGPDQLEVPEADLRSVYAETGGGSLYLLLTTEGKSNRNPAVSYCVNIDTNSDGKADYQAGFNTGDAWLWDLKGAGYGDPANLQSFISYESFFGRSIKFMLPLSLLKTSGPLRLQLYTFHNGKQANPRKGWVEAVQKS
jgi:hypothetical protein